MKKFVFLAVLVVVLLTAAGCTTIIHEAPPTPTRPAWPIWAQGDTWTYQSGYGEVVTVTVERVAPFRGELAYFVGSSQLTWLEVLRTSDLNPLALVAPISGAVIAETVAVRHWDWPFHVGKKWAYSGALLFPGVDGGTPVEGTVVVEAQERVTVPAGEFLAFRLVRVETTGGQSSHKTLWWSPVVRNVVRWEIFTPYRHDIFELETFQLAR